MCQTHSHINVIHWKVLLRYRVITMLLRQDLCCIGMLSINVKIRRRFLDVTYYYAYYVTLLYIRKVLGTCMQTLRNSQENDFIFWWFCADVNCERSIRNYGVSM